MRRSIRTLSAAAALCLVLAACGAAPGQSSPTSHVGTTVAPCRAPRSFATANAAPPRRPSRASTVPGDSVPIPPDTYARVVTDDLRVRSNPGVSDDSTKLEPLLQDGVQVVVLDGPVQASGYDWYLVQPTITSDTADPYPFGWVAAADKDGEPWIESGTASARRCHRG